MKTRNRNLLIGLTALSLCGSVLAHDPGRYPSHPEVGWAGNVALWGGSQGFSSWSGNISVGNVYGYAPGYIPWVAPLPSGHRHGPSCHHVARYAHERNHGKGHKHHRHHGDRQGRSGHGHD